MDTLSVPIHAQPVIKKPQYLGNGSLASFNKWEKRISPLMTLDEGPFSGNLTVPKKETKFR